MPLCPYFRLDSMRVEDALLEASLEILRCVL